MKTLTTLSFLFFALYSVNAQLREMLPAISPDGIVKQKIGQVELEILYGRPASRGRKIFGGLVPYGEIWRTGAGESTKLKFDKPVTIGGKLVPAGMYSLVTIPGEDRWSVMLNANTAKIFGAQQDGYDQETEVVRVVVPVQKSSHFYESLSFSIDIVNNNAEVIISWELTQVHFPIITTNNEEALKAIEKFLADHPTDIDNLSFAAYYLDVNNQSPELMLAYADRALNIKEDWWNYELKMNALAKNKRFDEAQKTFEQAIKFLKREKPDGWQETEKHWKSITQNWH